MPRAVFIGECMVEEYTAGDGRIVRGVGGDTFNAAVHFKRAAPSWTVYYATVLGDDPESDGILARARREGLELSLVRCLPGRRPGCYRIEVDAAGERRFHYDRACSAARELLSESDPELAAAVADSTLCFYSGITLAILREPSRARLRAMLSQRGGRCVFDPNYRAALWRDASTARRCIEGALRGCDFALPSLEDLEALFGVGEPESLLTQLRALCDAEVALKCGSREVLIETRDGRIAVPAQVVPHVTDTTGAGDAWDGAYLAARMSDDLPRAAARKAHAAAARSVTHPGALGP